MQERGIDFKTDPGGLKLTIQKFYRPSGSSTQMKGVASDIMLPSVTSVADIGETSLPNPLPWDTLPSANSAKLNFVTPYLSALRAKSDARVAADKDFALVKEEASRYQQMMSASTITLNDCK